MWITTDVFLDQHKPCQSKLELFFQVSFHWSYAVINNSIRHLWLLFSDYNPTVSLSHSSLFMGKFLFCFPSKFCPVAPQSPLEFQQSCWSIFSLLQYCVLWLILIPFPKGFASFLKEMSLWTNLEALGLHSFNGIVCIRP